MRVRDVGVRGFNSSHLPPHVEGQHHLFVPFARAARVGPVLRPLRHRHLLLPHTLIDMHGTGRTALTNSSPYLWVSISMTSLLVTILLCLSSVTILQVGGKRRNLGLTLTNSSSYL